MDVSATCRTMPLSEIASQPHTASILSSPPALNNPDCFTMNSSVMAPDMETKNSDITPSVQPPSQDSEDPFSLSQLRRVNLDKKVLKAEHPQAKLKEIRKFYDRQNELIEAYLGSSGEEAAGNLDMGAN
jgi:hypothetical protein